jgi:sugar lactone lactonase YvrE
VTAVEQLTPPLAHHGEGPIWDPVVGCLRWVDMLRGDVLTLAIDGSVDRLNVATVATAIRPRRGGGLVVGVERGFALVDPDGFIRTLPEIWDDPTVRMNDGACDPQGRFYCGSMAYDEAPGRGSLYRLDRDGSATVVLAGVTISNGLAWRSNGTDVVYVDTPTRCLEILAFNPEAGTFGDRRVLAKIDADRGMPDGIALDAEGAVWVALWEGGAVHRYPP